MKDKWSEVASEEKVSSMTVSRDEAKRSEGLWLERTQVHGRAERARSNVS